MKRRDTNVDVAKGICMLLIICIHTEVFGVIGMPLTFLAVPAFFFMSGFYDRSERPWNQRVKRSVVTLLLPAIIWCGIGAIYLNFLTYMKSHSVEFVFDVYNPCHYNGPAWFLLALFMTKILIGIILRLKFSKYVMMPLCLGVGYLGSAYQMPMNLDEALAAVPLYYVGKIIYPKLENILNIKYVAIVS